MTYILKHFDTPLIKFTADESCSNPDIKIIWINDTQRHLLPLDLQPDNAGLERWVTHRTIPKNRAYVHAFLAKCGLNINRPMSIISVSKGLSVNDCYWIVEEDFDGTFEKYNLYDNKFNQILSRIAFTGYGSSTKTSFVSCPEFTTNGMLPKCWRRVNGDIYLYKGGTSGASNTGNEPYSEYYACCIAETMEINTVKYKLTKWENTLCSACLLFTSKEYSFMPVGRIVTSGGMAAVEEYYKKLGTEFVKALNDMFIFDAVICNVDRHFGNFGFLVDNKTNTIAAPAPLFDHGNSLFNLAGNDVWENDESLQDYIDTLLPCTYDDYIQKAKSVLDNDNRKKLRHLFNFKFKKNPRYNLDGKRLKMIENQIRKRAREILDE